ncbi:hypothetical protein ACLIR7_18425 [Nitratireductor aquimarinus]|uniref:hypothetical protein n=1 Tax=Nitratireductor aquimarinus TaxID=889300 RepID=UPI00398E6C59
MSVLYLHSTYEEPAQAVLDAATRGEVSIVRQNELTPGILLAHKGLITGNQLDQNAMMTMRDALTAFLDAGGRWFFNGHMVRPLIDGLSQYRPICQPKRADFDLTSVNRHPLFDGIDLEKLETNKGVAGFYGRGCNPPPPGAVVINGLGSTHVPVDWVWSRPEGGRVFSHSGNDLGSMGREWGLSPQLARRIIDWAGGGTCLSTPVFAAKASQAETKLAPAETYSGMKSSRSRKRRLIAPSSGTYYHIHSLESPRYEDTFDVVCAPEMLADELRPSDALWVPCRTPAHRMIEQRDVVLRHLEAGGTVVALGESRSDLWMPGIEFTSVPTNWWWWLEPGADLGVSIIAPDHALLAGMGRKDLTWHLHGWFRPPEGAHVLATDHEDHAILYEDTVTTPGRMIVSSLDPFFHHGSHFMPATTRFLDRFIPNLKDYLNA